MLCLSCPCSNFLSGLQFEVAGWVGGGGGGGGGGGCR